MHAFVLDALAPDFQVGDVVETFIQREDAVRFIEDVRGDDPDLAAKLRIEEPERPRASCRSLLRIPPGQQR